MKFLSLFSGIEAASVAAPPGWVCVGFSEVNPFCCALLAEKFPHVPNLGDVTKITEEQIKALGHIDLVIFGFPCQDLSIAGQRKGMSHAGERTRSGLFFDAMRVTRWTGCRWLVIENVPGLFSSNSGRDFAAVVGEILGTEFDTPVRKGKKWQNSGVAVSARGLCEWATLDAKFFGVAQRRRRVFFVVDFGNWAGRPPLLLIPDGLLGDTPPRRETGQSHTYDLAPCLGASGRGFERTGDPRGNDAVIAEQHNGGPVLANAALAGTVSSKWAKGTGGPAGDECYNLVACADEVTAIQERAMPQAIAFTAKDYGADASDISPTLRAGNHTTSHMNGGVMPAVCFNLRGRDGGAMPEMSDVASVRAASGGSSKSYIIQSVVRRIMPSEAEKLQGFSGSWTEITYRGKPAADSQRYKSIGNSFCVPVVRWILNQIDQVANTPPQIPDTTEDPF